eukprot:scaffold304007_cov47-Prasinocladus_malaysianus.AAC.1
MVRSTDLVLTKRPHFVPCTAFIGILHSIIALAGPHKTQTASAVSYGLGIYRGYPHTRIRGLTQNVFSSFLVFVWPLFGPTSNPMHTTTLPGLGGREGQQRC